MPTHPLHAGLLPGQRPLGPLNQSRGIWGGPGCSQPSSEPFPPEATESQLTKTPLCLQQRQAVLSGGAGAAGLGTLAVSHL